MIFDFRVTPWFNNNYGNNKEIDNFCKKLCAIANNGNYTSKVDKFHVLPMIAPDALIAKGYGPELCKIELKYRIATITKRINFDEYMNGNIEEKKRLLVDCLFSAIEPNKRKLGFNLEDFKTEVNKLIE